MDKSPYVADPANPTDAELAAAIQRGLADGTLIDAADFLAGVREGAAPCEGHSTWAEHEAFIDRLTVGITDASLQVHPDDTEAAIQCAIAAAELLMPHVIARVCYPRVTAVYEGTLASAENMSPAGVEARIAGVRTPLKARR